MNELIKEAQLELQAEKIVSSIIDKLAIVRPVAVGPPPPELRSPSGLLSSANHETNNFILETARNDKQFSKDLDAAISNFRINMRKLKLEPINIDLTGINAAINGAFEHRPLVDPGVHGVTGGKVLGALALATGAGLGGYYLLDYLSTRNKK